MKEKKGKKSLRDTENIFKNPNGPTVYEPKIFTLTISVAL